MMTDKPNAPGGDEQELTAKADSNPPLQLGSLCPGCGEGKLDFNGLFELECLACGFREKGGSACGCSFRSDPV